MPQPIGMLAFKNGDGEMIYFEATTIHAITPATDPDRPDVKAAVWQKNGSYAPSIEESGVLAARYDGLVRRSREAD